ncbi:MAG: MarR family transcriptional regulator, partial [Thermoguttaceae bacterium]|nr:MarR family transcriptional regulator [Thermoguttaceae bacterium]
MNDNAKQSDQPLTRDCHCFNLRRATLAVIALYDRHMEGSGVTIQQFSILRHVSGNGALSVTELSELMGLDRTTLSRNLTLLERRGLLTTRPSSGRRRLTTLTDKGVYTAVFMAVRILSLVAVSALLTYTTTPTALTDGIEKLLSPV